LSKSLLERTQSEGIPTVLDAGSVHVGTLALMEEVDYLVCSEKFAQQFFRRRRDRFDSFGGVSPAVVITLGEKGLIWRRGQDRGLASLSYQCH